MIVMMSVMAILMMNLPWETDDHYEDEDEDDSDDVSDGYIDDELAVRDWWSLWGWGW